MPSSPSPVREPKASYLTLDLGGDTLRVHLTSGFLAMIVGEGLRA